MGKVNKDFLAEREVTFIEPEVKFVSLVGHAANRQPFTILKNDKGDKFMSKSVISVLLPKALSAEDTEKQLEGYKTTDSIDFETYVKYPQVAMEDVKENTVEVVFLDTATKSMAVIGELKSGDSISTPGKAEKEALDYATQDSVFGEAYALLDIVYGTMSQSVMTGADREAVLLSAIKNFGTFVSQLFNAMPASKSALPVVVRDIPVFESTVLSKKEDVGMEMNEKTIKEIVSAVVAGLSVADTEHKAADIKETTTVSEATESSTDTGTVDTSIADAAAADASIKAEKSKVEDSEVKILLKEINTKFEAGEVKATETSEKMKKLETELTTLKSQPKTQHVFDGEISGRGVSKKDDVFKGTFLGVSR